MVKYVNHHYSIVLGSLFGDEGKGITTQGLCRNFLNADKKPIVCRFSGGPQAGHTVENNGIRHICSTYGAGTLVGVPTYLTSSFMVDPICLINEYKSLLLESVLEGKPQFNIPKLYISSDCRVITPYDVMNGQSDAIILKHGTCGKGIFPTFKRYRKAEGIIFRLIKKDWTFFEVIKHPLDYLNSVKSYYNIMEFDPAYDIEFIQACNMIRENRDQFDVRDADFSHSGLFDEIIYEGSQGLLLDMESGFMPNCTPSKVGLNGIPDFVFKQDDTDVYLVVRSYLTRHGNGYKPVMARKIFPYIKGDYETNVNNPWQGEFKIGIFDIDLLNRAFDRAHLNNYNAKFNLVVTHVDDLHAQRNSDDKENRTRWYYLSNKNLNQINLFEDKDQSITEYNFKDTWLKILINNIDTVAIQNLYYTDSIDSDLKKW
jgi:adenylosuccinate synthase